MAIAHIPDAAIHSEAEDVLGRKRFARAIAALIAEAPKDTSLRIGVYGSWGEGKSSVLQLIRRTLLDAGHVCVWITPWLTERPEELAAQLTTQIADSLSLDISEETLAQKATRVLDKGAALGESDWRISAGAQILAAGLRRTAKEAAAKQGAQLARAIDEALGDRKLVVFVDDVDRVSSERVPALLLTIREALARPNTYYVMALDPTIVERSLATQNQAWGSPRAFLEKVIELPRYLPAVSSDDLERYITHLADSSGATSAHRTLADLAPHLSTNPRRLKLTVRFFALIEPVVARFAEFELPRRPFYLVQLLAFEFPEETRALLSEDGAVRDIEYGWFSRRSGEDNQSATSILVEKYAPGDPRARERFLALCSAIRNETFGAWAHYDLRAQASIVEAPPAFTFHEVSLAVSRWEEGPSDRKRDQLIALLGSRAEDASESERDFWNKLATLRDLHLGGTAEQVLEADVRAGLATATAMLEIAQFIAIERRAFATGTLSSQEWLSFFHVAARWAHFRSLDYYDSVRAMERDLVLRSFEDLPQPAKAALYARLAERGDTTSAEPDPGAHWKDLAGRLDRAVSEAAGPLAIELFRVPDGLASLWSSSHDSFERLLLFEPTSWLHTEPAAKRQLLDCAAEAQASAVVQQNFLTFFRQLVHGSTEPGNFGTIECREILSDRELLSAIWSAAVARPLNPRLAGSLREERARAARVIATAADLPEPEWWRALEKARFFSRAGDG